MRNHYETVFILTPVLSDAQIKEAVDKFKAVITDNDGVITNEENWGMRKLAYPIQKKSTGFYILLQFDGEPTLVDKLETQFKYAYQYAEKRKRGKSEVTEVEPEKTDK